MMVEQAKVLDYLDGTVLVQCFAKSGCGGCAASGHCGTQALSALAGEKKAPQLRLSVPFVLEKGDVIEIGLKEKSLLLSAFWLYLVPLCAVIVSAFFLSSLFDNELLVALGIFLSLVGTFYTIKINLQRKPMGQFTPVFLRKL